MDRILNELAREEGLISIWAAIGAILLFLFVLYLLSKFMYSENRNKSPYMGLRNKSNVSENKGISDDEPVKDKTIWGGEKRTYSNSIHLNDNINEEKESIKHPSTEKTSVAENGKNQSPKEQLQNIDGTEEIDNNFDSTNDNFAPVSSSPKYEYLETANNGQFRKLLPSGEKCFFRTWEENGTRKFEFHGNVDKALANINAIFDDVCEIEGKQNGATQIDNVEPGILNSQLKVEKKAVIKLT